ncbi:monovalent cation/H(+) antiporter subunit G [Woodsholea maritima]|uniref:monovalent cation/H(+) antiporter subunit G n=1 Tax=Woodsholea maritima TaxID=240237 RepID=UPI00037A9835|nr:monovalent cation/H(+) antiporter subunit G [Woodsholea maritima]
MDLLSIALSIILDLLSAGFMLAGVGFVLAGTIGVMRLPDFYTRMHAAGVTDTLGAELIIIGLVIQAGFTLVAAKLLLLGFFLFLTSPTATHAVANAAYKAGLAPMLSRFKPPHPRDAGKGEG